MPKKPLFAGLAHDPYVPTDYIPPEERRNSLPAPATRPSMRPASRYHAQAHNALDPDSAFRTLTMEGEDCEFRPLTRAEGAARLGITPEHVAERKQFPLLDADLNPRLRTKPGTLPKGCRATPGARVTSSRDAWGKPQPNAPAGERRARSVEKVIFTRNKGMSAKLVVSRAEQDRAAEYTAQLRYAEFLAAEMADREAARAQRDAARMEMRAAQGRERDALARGYTEIAAMARLDIRKWRKLSAFKGV